MDFASKGICRLCRDGLLRAHYADYLRPVGGVALLFELIAYCVDYPVGKQSGEEVGIGAVILLVVDGTQVEAGLELSVRTLYLTGEVVVFPCIEDRRP